MGCFHRVEWTFPVVRAGSIALPDSPILCLSSCLLYKQQQNIHPSYTVISLPVYGTQLHFPLYDFISPLLLSFFLSSQTLPIISLSPLLIFTVLALSHLDIFIAYPCILLTGPLLSLFLPFPYVLGVFISIFTCHPTYIQIPS